MRGDYQEIVSYGIYRSRQKLIGEGWINLPYLLAVFTGGERHMDRGVLHHMIYENGAVKTSKAMVSADGVFRWFEA